MKKLLWILVLLLVLSASVFASVIILFNQEQVAGNTYYISTSGSDTLNSCTEARDPGRPKRNLAGAQGALACLASGDRLIISGGTYTEGIQDNAIPSGVDNSQHTRIEAASGETVILNGEVGVSGGTSGTTALLWIFSGSFITIQNIIFDCDQVSGNCIYIGRAGAPAPNPNQPSHHIKLIGCEVRDTPLFSGIANGFNQDALVDTSNSFINVKSHHHGLQSTAPTQHHGLYLTGQNNLVDGGEYDNNTGHGIHAFAHDVSGGNNGTIIRGVKASGNGTSGIGVYDGQNMQVLNSIVHDNGSISQTGGIRVGLRAHSTKVYANTSYGQLAGGYGIWVVSGGTAIPTGTDIRNNIAFANTGANINNLGSGTNASGNVCLAVSSMCQIATANPMFLNAAARNFHLLPGSPAIGAGAGVDISATLTTDYDGQTRTVPFDAGALEFVAPIQSITLTAPNGGESWLKTSSQTIAWTTANITDVRIRADRGNDGVFEETIAASTPSDGSFDWIPGGTENANVKIEICDASDNTPCAVSVAPFAITAAAGAVITKILSDNSTGDIPGTSDGRLEQAFATSNFGGALTLSVHKRSASNHAHSVLGFTGLSQIPTNAVVNRVKVRVRLRTVTGTNTHTVNFRRILRPNPEFQRSWNNAATGVAWTTPGGIGAGTDRVAAVSGQITGVGTTIGTFYEVDQTSGGMVDDVQFWVSNPTNNYFWHLELDGIGEDDNAKGFNSKESPDGERPSMELTYTTTVQTITVTQPPPGAQFTSDSGQVVPIRWQTEGVSGNAKAEISYNGGLTFQAPPIVSSYPFSSVDLSWPVTGQTCDQCMIKVTSLNDPNVFGLSALFSIGSPIVMMY